MELPSISLTVIALIRVAIGFILLIAGISKVLMGGDRFSKAIRAYELLPSWTAEFLAKWLPRLELMVGTLLIFGLWTKLVAAASVWLLGIFIAAVSVSLLRGKDINCGCFGRVTENMSWRIAVRNAVLLILSLLVYAHSGGVATADSWLRQQFSNTGWPVSLMRIAATFVTVGPVMGVAMILRLQRVRQRLRLSIS